MEIKLSESQDSDEKQDEESAGISEIGWKFTYKEWNNQIPTCILKSQAIMTAPSLEPYKIKFFVEIESVSLLIPENQV